MCTDGSKQRKLISLLVYETTSAVRQQHTFLECLKPLILFLTNTHITVQSHTLLQYYLLFAWQRLSLLYPLTSDSLLQNVFQCSMFNFNTHE